MPFEQRWYCTDCGGQVLPVTLCTCGSLRQKRYDEVQAAWDNWQLKTGQLQYAIPSVDHMPDEVAIEGPCVLFDLPDWAAGEAYCSPVLKSPTWGEVAREFDKAIPVTCDKHNVYLEGLHVDHPTPLPVPREMVGVAMRRFSTGS